MAQLSYLTEWEQLVQAAQRLHQAGVLSHSGHGNMSAHLLHCCLAAGGLRDNKLHTTAICSPTHAILAART